MRGGLSCGCAHPQNISAPVRLRTHIQSPTPVRLPTRMMAHPPRLRGGAALGRTVAGKPSAARIARRRTPRAGGARGNATKQIYHTHKTNHQQGKVMAPGSWSWSVTEGLRAGQQSEPHARRKDFGGSRGLVANTINNQFFLLFSFFQNVNKIYITPAPLSPTFYLS